MALIAFHSAYLPVGYGLQFSLPDGRYLTMADAAVGKHRALWFNSVTRGSYPRRTLSALYERPKRLREVGPWFEGARPRELRLARSLISSAIEMAWGNGDDIRDADVPLIDPYAPAARLDPQIWRLPDSTEEADS